MIILNLTQHPATADQVEAGVYDLLEVNKGFLAGLLTFSAPPSALEMESRAEKIALLAAAELEYAEEILGVEREFRVMIGGAPFFMSALERALVDRGITPVYAFSRRESVEEVQADGSVRKANVFRHAGFVSPTGV